MPSLPRARRLQQQLRRNKRKAIFMESLDTILKEFELGIQRIVDSNDAFENGGVDLAINRLYVSKIAGMVYHDAEMTYR